MSFNKETPNQQKETLLFALLNNWIFGAKEQINRIKIDQINCEKSIACRKEEGHNQDWIKDQKCLFLDIHFFLIAIANISKVMETLKKIKSKESEFVAIYKKHDHWLGRLRIMFRNLLEHITEGQIDGNDKNGNPLKNLGDFGNLHGDDFTLFGKIFNVPNTFSTFETLCSDLKKWSDSQVEKFYAEKGLTR